MSPVNNQPPPPPLPTAIILRRGNRQCGGGLIHWVKSLGGQPPPPPPPPPHKTHPGCTLVSLGRLSERAFLGMSRIQGDELKGTREREKEGLQTLNRIRLALPECWQSQLDCRSHVILYQYDIMMSRTDHMHYLLREMNSLAVFILRPFPHI